MSSIVNRRRQDRYYRRIQVRFWIQGESKAHQGITNNLSLHGAFVNSHMIFPRGTRVRLELHLPGGPLYLEGVIAHAHRMPPELRALGTPGMGVRFLPPEELLGPLLKAEAAAAPEREAAAQSPPETEMVYPVRFDSSKRFVDSYHRDLLNGGIFVRTPRPSRMRETVALELHVPGSEGRVIPARGRVVQVVETRSTPTGTATGGMGLELIDLESLLRELKPIVEGLEKAEGASPA